MSDYERNLDDFINQLMQEGGTSFDGSGSIAESHLPYQRHNSIDGLQNYQTLDEPNLQRQACGDIVPGNDSIIHEDLFDALPQLGNVDPTFSSMKGSTFSMSIIMLEQPDATSPGDFASSGAMPFTPYFTYDRDGGGLNSSVEFGNVHSQLHCTPQDFKFESGATQIGSLSVVPSNDSSVISSPGTDASVGRYRCDWVGCKTSKTFKRKIDLNRHTAKHMGRRIPCTAIGCGRKGAKGFYRDDKLRDHVQAMHNADTELKCPKEGCSVVQAFDRMAEHVCRQHFAVPDWSWLLERESRFCPLSRCRKVTRDPASLQCHLFKKHTLEELLMEAEAVADAGYDPTTRNFSCPVCGITEAAHRAIISHINDKHVITDKAHFSTWKNRLWEVGRIYPIQAWDTWHNFGSAKIIVCPRCGHNENIAERSDDTHHLSMLTPSSELYPYRQAILKIFPKFASHPVFKD